jgi:hypothetical protein
MNKLSSQDKTSLIKLASSLPVGSAERRAILAGLKKVSWMDSPPDFSSKSGEKELERAKRIIDEYPAAKRINLFRKIYNTDMSKYEDSGELELENDKRLLERDMVLPRMNQSTSVGDVIKHEKKILEVLSR